MNSTWLQSPSLCRKELLPIHFSSMKIYHGCNCIWLLHTFVNFTHQLLKDVFNTEVHTCELSAVVGRRSRGGWTENQRERVGTISAIKAFTVNFREGASAKLEDIIINLGAVGLRICPRKFLEGWDLPWWWLSDGEKRREVRERLLYSAKKIT